MFGFKRVKSQQFTDVLDQIEPVGDAQSAVLAPVAPSQANQPQDWLLQMLSGLLPQETEAKIDAAAVASARESSYLEDAVEPLLQAIASCEQDAIAEELGLGEHLSVPELKRLRRDFARENHPDRLDPSQRELATHRMTIANMLIDRELRQKNLPPKPLR